jgi:hypothetical protein
MSLQRNLLLISWGLLLVAAPAVASVPHAVPGVDGKPADPRYAPVRSAFDCAGRDTLTLIAGSPVVTLQDSTTGGTNTIDNYPCAPWNELGPEHIYRLEVTEELEFWAGLRNTTDEVDHDLFLLSDCDTDSCLVGANTELSARLAPGTYYLVVDGAGTANPAAGPYTLEYVTRWPGVPPVVCVPGFATPVDGAATELDLDNNLFGKADLMRSYDCSPLLVRGGEAWYALTLPGIHEVTVSFTAVAAALDVALWLFDGCGPEAVCLDYANDKIGGQSEQLLILNEGAEPVTVYLGVDSFRAPTDTFAGQYTIRFAGQSNVAIEKKSLGSVRALYR